MGAVEKVVELVTAVVAEDCTNGVDFPKSTELTNLLKHNQLNSTTHRMYALLLLLLLLLILLLFLLFFEDKQN